MPTPETQLAKLPADRRELLEAVRRVILQHLPEGYEETVENGMLAYVVPLSRYPNTYNRRPLQYVALAAQKGYCALYLVGAYSDPEVLAQLVVGFRAAGKKLDMGKSCLRFHHLSDLPLDVIGHCIAALTPDGLIERYEAARRAAIRATNSAMGEGARPARRGARPR